MRTTFRNALQVALVALTLTLTVSAANAAPGQSLEAKIISLTNIERQKAGLQPLRFDPALTNCARQHSDEMFRLNYFSHRSPVSGYETLSERAARAGVPVQEVGENIAYYDGYSLDQVAKRVVTDWMNSPTHRANVLYPGFAFIGVGIASNGKRTLVTQNFSVAHDGFVPGTSVGASY
jgi:uncharacterized protein YkwD